MKILYALLLAALPAASFAAGGGDGVAAAKGTAGARAPGYSLVEIEGFADWNGDIPCGKRYSANWHYKFYSSSEASWFLVNACGGAVLNTAKHFPADAAAEPRTALPRLFMDSVGIMKKLKKEGLFTAKSTALDRDMYMRMAWLPEAGPRPAGCYWSVTRGKEKTLVDCDGLKRYSAAPPPAKAAAADADGALAQAGGGKKVKARDAAGRYVKVAIKAMQKRYPGSVLKAVESLVDKTGSAKCMAADDGWMFIFSMQNSKGETEVLGGCKGKTEFIASDYSGKNNYVNAYAPLPDVFKDSDEAMGAVPAACLAGRSTAIMKLQNFKPKAAPVTGHTFIWQIDCGQKRYYVDAVTGRSLGEGRKTATGGTPTPGSEF